jgi:hypothetical protein
MPGGSEATKSKDDSSSSSQLSALKKAAMQAKPFLEKAEPYIRQAYPYVVIAKDKAMTVYAYCEQRYDDEVGTIALGLVLLFFGGQFAMTISAWQIFRISGKQTIVLSWRALQDSFKEAFDNLAKDEMGERVFGTVDDKAKRISMIAVAMKDLAVGENEKDKAKAREKVALLLKCIDPNKVWEAAGGLFTGLLAILAALRSRFVQCITMGHNAGRKVVEIIEPMVQPKLHETFPGHVKWVDFLLHTGGGIVGGLISLFLIKFISAGNSALEGGDMLVKRLKDIGERKGIFKQYMNDWQPTPEQTRIITVVCAAVGFIMQLRSGFSLPLLLKIILFPVCILEYILTILAARPIV